MLTQLNLERLKNCDLNLLLALAVLLNEAHVSNAAKQLGLSQSAMSQTLKRLRLMFADPLLLKSNNGMTLTNKAQAIALELTPLLDKTARILEADHFSPKTAQGRIRFIMNDITAQLIMTPLIALMSEQAPGIELEYISQSANGFQLLRRGQVDAVIGFYDDVPTPLSSQVIGKSSWQMVTHKLSNSQHKHIDESAIKLLRYQFQEHNQLHSLASLEQINAENAAYALTTASLSALLYALQTNNTATLLPHFALNILPEQQIQEFAWLGKPIKLDLKVCWDRHHRAPELQRWFRQQLATLLHQHLPLEKVS
ncbi:LysR family transcriptional regulator [Shewanella fidelis]|uniref:LysR family transcriptional regulator n=1 Tax=Shewanella fidelis TaxID=173509 RepID=A0AAW8NTX7_9GAMM|nr:LysR family transcriptional regulator [Shewanella fidelis]MDR8525349.1 LysR family transcriptional regulator [Shewanella fidelis]MDW4813614.1 LysR family transcriptional regulator [Shewanella fidelis]MDW4817728.1 LysR family transcriptional regulator [Shewanella fidelis]MDW4821795.1 LysR family transcriptional regulator [Shewanella fidelis]MDW4825942.1 LysR family transcriptional regulator [Shewanella fidelis]